MKKLTQATLYVDPRTGSAHLLGPLLAHGIKAKLKKLDYGDVAFGGNGRDGGVDVGIELKTVDDLLQSLTSKRLVGHQVPGMVAMYSVRYLLIEGLWRPGDDGLVSVWRGAWKNARTHVTYAAVSRFLTTLEHRAGFLVRRSGGSQETAQIISDIYRWFAKPWRSHQAHLDFDHSRDAPPDGNLLNPTTVLEDVASKLPGIGWKLARRVGRRFKSVREMANAEAEDWTTIPRVGAKTALALAKVISGEEPYGTKVRKRGHRFYVVE